MSNPFEILGLPKRFSLPRAELEQRHRDLSRTLHPDRYTRSPAGERRLALERAVAVNEAFRTLRDPFSRAQSLLGLHGVSTDDRERPPAELLMEVMELREALDEAREDSTRVEALRSEVNTRASTEERAVSEVFDRDGDIDPGALSRAKEALVRWRYLHRFLEEADALLEH